MHSRNTPRSIGFSLTKACGCQVWEIGLSDFTQRKQVGVEILISLDDYLRTQLKENTRYDQCEFTVSRGECRS